MPSFILNIVMAISIVSVNSLDVEPSLYTNKIPLQNRADNTYYVINLCNHESPQLQIDIIIGNNFDCNNNQMILGQISTIENDFGPNHTITTYNWNNGNYQGNCRTILNIPQNTSQLWLRFMAMHDSIYASFEITYVSNKPVSNNPFSTLPFLSNYNNNNIIPIGMMQYWRMISQQAVIWQDYKYINVLYCQQKGLSISAINSVVASLYNETTSLFTQGACQYDTPEDQCVAQSNNHYDWYTAQILPFSSYVFTKASGLTVDNGLLIWVQGLGGDDDKVNYFTFYAIVQYGNTMNLFNYTKQDKISRLLNISSN